MKYQGIDSGKEPGLYIRAIKNISRGKQIFWNYGDKGNYEFLKLYGFILVDGTQPKKYRFFVDLEKPWQAEPSNTPQELQNVKKELYAVWKGKNRVKFEVGEDFDSDTLKQLVAYLRIEVFDDVENLDALTAIKSQYLESKTCPPISTENEL